MYKKKPRFRSIWWKETHYFCFQLWFLCICPGTIIRLSKDTLVLSVPNWYVFRRSCAWTHIADIWAHWLVLQTFLSFGHLDSLSLGRVRSGLHIILQTLIQWPRSHRLICLVCLKLVFFQSIGADELVPIAGIYLCIYLLLWPPSGVSSLLLGIWFERVNTKHDSYSELSYHMKSSSLHHQCRHLIEFTARPGAYLSCPEWRSQKVSGCSCSNTPRHFSTNSRSRNVTAMNLTLPTPYGRKDSFSSAGQVGLESSGDCS